MTRQPWRLALAAAPLLLAVPALRHGIESRMLLHMLLEFPLLFAAGWAAGRALPPRHSLARALRRIDAHGLLGLTLATLVAAFWMLPAALDASLLSPAVQAAKLAVWWLAGALLGCGWHRVSPELFAFFAGNVAWMMATAGLIYQEAEERLCANYLLGDQARTGVGLVAAAVLLGGFALLKLVRWRTRAHATAGSSAAWQRPGAGPRPPRVV